MATPWKTGVLEHIGAAMFELMPNSDLVVSPGQYPWRRPGSDHPDKLRHHNNNEERNPKAPDRTTTTTVARDRCVTNAKGDFIE